MTRTNHGGGLKKETNSGVTGQVRILVADRTRLGCESLANTLRRIHRLSVVCAVTPAEALKAAEAHLPDVAIISAHFGSEPNGGLRIAEALSASNPRPKIVILLDSPEPHAVVGAFRSGAVGIFCRDEPIESLSKCVLGVHKGQIWVNASQMEFVQRALVEATPLKITNRAGQMLLSEREMQVVRCVVDGLTNRETAEKLKLSEHTVKNYLYRIFDKLGVSSRVEVALYALSRVAPRASAELEFIPDADASLEFSGTSQSLAESAESGRPFSQFALGRMLMDGTLKPEDEVSAYKWLLLAEESASAIRIASKEALEELALRMNAGQIGEAEGLASEWNAQHEHLKSDSPLSFDKREKAHRGPQFRYRKGSLVKIA